MSFRIGTQIPMMFVLFLPLLFCSRGEVVKFALFSMNGVPSNSIAGRKLNLSRPLPKRVVSITHFRAQ